VKEKQDSMISLKKNFLIKQIQTKYFQNKFPFGITTQKIFKTVHFCKQNLSISWNGNYLFFNNNSCSIL